jgi:hypothetical protein
MSAKPARPPVEPACPAKRARKPRGPNAFKQRDLTRAIRAARAAGEDNARIEIDKDGKIVVILGKPQVPAPELVSDVDKWLAGYNAIRN